MAASRGLPLSQPFTTRRRVTQHTTNLRPYPVRHPQRPEPYRSRRCGWFTLAAGGVGLLFVCPALRRRRVPRRRSASTTFRGREGSRAPRRIACPPGALLAVATFALVTTPGEANKRVGRGRAGPVGYLAADPSSLRPEIGAAPEQACRGAAMVDRQPRGISPRDAATLGTF